MSSTVGNIKISPINATWEIEEQVCVDMKGAVAADLQDKYFNIYDGVSTYNVIYDVDATGIVSPGGGTDIEVDVLTGDSVATILGNTQTAIEAATGYNGRLEDTRLFLTLDTTISVASDAADVDTGFSVDVVSKGGFVDLGLLEGDVEPSFSEDKLPVTAHQTGTSILAELRQGNNAEVTLVLKESSNGLYKEIFGAGGADFTPAAGTEIFGWGDSKQGANTITNARRLRFHPVALPDTDRSEDLTFWLAYPNPDSIVFSGENFNVLNVTFVTYLDLGKPKEVRRFCFGDSSQDGIEVGL
jgi:hypothetical protein